MTDTAAIAIAAVVVLVILVPVILVMREAKALCSQDIEDEPVDIKTTLDTTGDEVDQRVFPNSRK